MAFSRGAYRSAAFTVARLNADNRAVLAHLDLDLSDAQRLERLSPTVPEQRLIEMADLVRFLANAP
jgi:hypothetical protein